MVDLHKKQETTVATKELKPDSVHKRERHDCPSKQVQVFLEGNKLVIERNDGEDVEVRDLTPEELDEIKADRHQTLKSIPLVKKLTGWISP